MHEELRLDKQICFRLYTAARLITQAYTPMLNELGITYPQYLVLMVLWEQAYAIIPAGMGKELKACPFQQDDYAKFASELDTIIETLKNKEK